MNTASTKLILRIILIHYLAIVGSFITAFATQAVMQGMGFMLFTCIFWFLSFPAVLFMTADIPLPGWFLIMLCQSTGFGIVAGSIITRIRRGKYPHASA